jgi:hypothetical protein
MLFVENLGQWDRAFWPHRGFLLRDASGNNGESGTGRALDSPRGLQFVLLGVRQRNDHHTCKAKVVYEPLLLQRAAAKARNPYHRPPQA